MHAIPPKLIAAPITMIRQLLLSPIIKIKPPINIKSIPSRIIIHFILLFKPRYYPSY